MRRRSLFLRREFLGCLFKRCICNRHLGSLHINWIFDLIGAAAFEGAFFVRGIISVKIPARIVRGDFVDRETRLRLESQSPVSGAVLSSFMSDFLLGLVTRLFYD